MFSANTTTTIVVVLRYRKAFMNTTKICRMRNRTKLESYHDIFMSIVCEPRCTITQIASNLGHTGRGRRRATISDYLHQMYDNKISFYPNLVLRDFENLHWKAYLCRKNKRSNIGETFNKLHKNNKINYVLFISGDCDFFLTSRDPTLDLEQYDLEIIESSKLYSPLFTIPEGWKLSFEEASTNIFKLNFEKGNLSRDTKGLLDWEELDMKIFELMRENVRRPFTEVARETGVFSATIKDHFYRRVLPSCKVAHYFFPKGYNTYMWGLIRIHTKYEKSIVHALEKLPCTSYVYPLEEGLLIILFHENINIIMTAIGKMEENGVIEQYIHFTPLWYKHI